MDITKLANLPESNTLEFKRDASALESILRAVVAFANTAGGIILVGVDDDGVIVGLQNPSKDQEKIVNSLANRVKPFLSPDFSIVKVADKQVLVIQVDFIPAPYYLMDKGETDGVYVRLGNTNRTVSNEAVLEMKRAAHHPFFDKAPCDNSSETDLDMFLIHKTFAKSHTEIDTAKLLSIGILTHKGKRIVATNGGIILFGKAEVREKYFPFAEVRCARFVGTTRAEFIDRLEIDGGILAAIEEVPKFIRRNTQMAGKFGAMQRRDIPEYPTDGIREVLTNALVHANYEIPGTRIFVAIYDDKLEIQNPGIMPPGMNIEQFKAGVSRLRNPVLARVFRELELIEEWGSGYKRIKEACSKGGYPEPIWEELGTVLRVTFFPHPEITSQLSAADLRHQGTKSEPRHQVKEEEFNTIVKKICEFCREPRLMSEILTLLNRTDRTKFRKRYIYPLIEKNMLELTIPDKPQSSNQRYVITEIGKKFIEDMK
jgi:ATP-dependent DNA helicase RecG